MRVATLLLCASALGFAGSWSGFLVDSRCYASRQNNVSRNTTTVTRDMDMDIRFCSPGAKTREFAVVLNDWQSLKFDPAGNERASELVQRAPKRSVFRIAVSGVLNKKTLKVGSISVASIKTQR
jgi:hypothetical protein